MIYIASPYSAPESLTREAERAEHRTKQYRAVNQFMVSMFRAVPEWAAISPIVLMHEATMYNDMPTDAASYWKFNKALIDASSKMIVLRLPGWVESKGVTMEIDYCASIGKTVLYNDPWTYDDMLKAKAL